MKKLVYTTDQALEILQVTHDNKYTYPNFNYTGSSELIEIECQKHGLFKMKFSSHASQTKPQGCKQCGIESRVKKRSKSFSKEEFLIKAKQKHGEKFDYSELSYPLTLNNVLKLKCPFHGQFEQSVLQHFKSDCRSCSYTQRGKNRLKDLNTFIEDSKRIFGDLYDYSKFIYKGNKTKRCFVL